MPLTLLTGPISSGKSTWLRSQMAGKEGRGGVLSLRTPEADRRVFFNVQNGEQWSMHPTAENPHVWEVGRFCFSQASFQMATGVLREAIQKPEIKKVVVDEIGPLELRGQGLADVLPQLLEWAAHPSDRHLIWVVRQGLEEKVLTHWGIPDRHLLIRVIPFRKESPESGDAFL